MSAAISPEVKDEIARKVGLAAIDSIRTATGVRRFFLDNARANRGLPKEEDDSLSREFVVRHEFPQQPEPAAQPETLPVQYHTHQHSGTVDAVPNASATAAMAATAPVETPASARNWKTVLAALATMGALGGAGTVGWLASHIGDSGDERLPQSQQVRPADEDESLMPYPALQYIEDVGGHLAR